VPEEDPDENASLGISLVGTYDTGFLLEIHTESINADAMF